jgi:hypothetical protein
VMTQVGMQASKPCTCEQQGFVIDSSFGRRLLGCYFCTGYGLPASQVQASNPACPLPHPCRRG